MGEAGKKQLGSQLYWYWLYYLKTFYLRLTSAQNPPERGLDMTLSVKL